MPNQSQSPFFSRDYCKARAKFINEAADAGIRHHHAYTHPELAAPDGSPLTTDVAWQGPKDARRVLLVSSGLHGIEGFAGSAIQTSGLAGGLVDPLPADMAVVMVHALNPYGFAHYRRVNEDNVDLNRNFRDWSKPPPEEHFLTAKVQSLLRPGERWCWPIFSLLATGLWHGPHSLQAAFQQGQYSFPEGIFYGGDKPTWSNGVWQDILTKWTAGAEQIDHIDIHTGLGPYGHGEVIITEPPDSPAERRARKRWGEVKSTTDGSSVSANTSGNIEHAFNEAARHKRITSVTLEFGTISPLSVLKALAYDNWAHAKGKTGPALEEVKDRMLKAFAPPDPAWQNTILRRGNNVLMQAKATLAQG